MTTNSRLLGACFMLDFFAFVLPQPIRTFDFIKATYFMPRSTVDFALKKLNISVRDRPKYAQDDTQKSLGLFN